MSPRLQKAKRASESARLLYRDGDFNGAINRGYYAIFHAVRSYLESRGEDVSTTKTHRGLTIVFRSHIEADPALDVSIAQAMQRTLEQRINADYDIPTAVDSDAAAVLRDMEIVLAALIARLEGDGE